ncbi:hypothetical protein ACWCHM_08645 [Micromonospora sp. SCSIO 07396]
MAQLLAVVDGRVHRIVFLDAAGTSAGAGPVEHLPATATVVAELPDPADSRRLLVVLDDAHRIGHSVVQALHDLHRRTGAALLLTRPTGLVVKPDPLDCLRYESGATFLTLAPLDKAQTWVLLNELVGGQVRDGTVTALHAATSGNPRHLTDLVLSNRLAERLVEQDGWRRLPAGLPGPLRVDEAGRRRLREALEQAWRQLSLEPLHDLCTLMTALGPTEDVAPVLAMSLLLTGRAEQGLQLLDTPAHRRDGTVEARTVLTRALLLAFGTGRIDAAVELLGSPTARASVPESRLAAVRAWILSVTGRDDPVGATPLAADPAGDPEAMVFARAAAATRELNAGRPRQAVPHLRRAIIGARQLHEELPWLSPLLTSALIDALLLAGRVNEATAAAASFHAAQNGSGWDAAVSLSALIRSASVAELAFVDTH